MTSDERGPPDHDALADHTRLEEGDAEPALQDRPDLPSEAAPADPFEPSAVAAQMATGPTDERPAATAAGNPVLVGIACKMVAIAIFSVMWALIKTIGDSIPVGQVVFARSFFAFIPIGFLVARAGGWRVLKTRRPLGHLMRSTAGLTAMALMFAAVVRIPLADVTAFGFAAPLFTTIFAALLLRETVRLYRWGAVLVGLLGVVVMLEPSGLQLFAGGLTDTRYAVGTLMALAGAIFVALAMIALRRMSSTETSLAIVFYFTLSGTVASGVTLPFVWVTPTGLQLALLVAVGLMGGVGQVFLTLAYRYGAASVLAPFDYTSLVWATANGMAVFAEFPHPQVLLGAAIVIVAGLFILHRERRRGVVKARAPGDPL